MKQIFLAGLLAGVFATPALAVVKNLAGTSWAPGPGQTITFGKGGRVSGSGGCNRFFGRYVQTGKYLRFSKIAATRMFCGGRKGAGEHRLFTRLGKVYWFKGTARRVLLFNRNSDIILVLEGRR